eukprot:GHVR01072728.1.p1 GENE.GHVR01072728.1~~GHVR01072728.1.p1  ORF type:complete len:142 (+),score=8.23 GHVR01072728.1:215-640(+)
MADVSPVGYWQRSSSQIVNSVCVVYPRLAIRSGYMSLMAILSVCAMSQMAILQRCTNVVSARLVILSVWYAPDGDTSSVVCARMAILSVRYVLDRRYCQCGTSQIGDTVSVVSAMLTILSVWHARDGDTISVVSAMLAISV